MRIRSSLAFGLVAVATAACSGGPGDDGATKTSSADLSSARTTAPSYLALGDSIAFGDDGYVPWGENPTRANPANFLGYPTPVAALLRGDPNAVTNLGCPGETTGSFLDTATPDNGCNSVTYGESSTGTLITYEPYKTLGCAGGQPCGAYLHTAYGTSQMAAAIAYVTTHEVSLVTIDLGGNDLLLLEYSCATSTGTLNLTCVTEALPGVITTAATNVATIGGTLRAYGYTREIVFLTQYATSYTDATQTTVIPLFNTAIAAAVATFGGRLASGYQAFDLASVPEDGNPCAAHLLIPNPDGTATCDKHPSAEGRDLLGLATVIAAE
jgi:hypothetical protein